MSLRQRTIWSYPTTKQIEPQTMPRQAMDVDLASTQSSATKPGMQYTLQPTAKPIKATYTRPPLLWASVERRRRRDIV